MKRDFTLMAYHNLLNAFLAEGYVVMPYSDYCANVRADKMLVLRHDVDRHPVRALRMATLEHELGIRSSYYFRAEYIQRADLISAVASLGHEVGYHYEDLASAKGNAEAAYAAFRSNLARMRDIVPVSTVVMHGSPLSSIDNRDLWKTYDYHALDILGEPYIDIDFSTLFYITDTGRSWDGITLRDSVTGYNDSWHKKGLAYHSTSDIMAALHDRTFPLKLMMNSHPQRWNDNLFPWAIELIMQSIKNILKRLMILTNLNNK